MGDRALGARALDESAFALFSYYYLPVLAAMALQQAVNTRFLAVVALRHDPSANARDATRHAGIMFVLCALLACIVMVPLSLNDTYSTRTDTTLLILVAVLAGLRGADFFQAALLARGARVHVIAAQLVYFAGLTLTLIAADGITQLLAGMVTAAAIYLTTVALLMWRLPLQEVGRDDTDLKDILSLCFYYIWSQTMRLYTVIYTDSCHRNPTTTTKSQIVDPTPGVPPLHHLGLLS